MLSPSPPIIRAGTCVPPALCWAGVNMKIVSPPPLPTHRFPLSSKAGLKGLASASGPPAKIREVGAGLPLSSICSGVNITRLAASEEVNVLLTQKVSVRVKTHGVSSVEAAFVVGVDHHFWCWAVAVNQLVSAVAFQRV